MHHRFWFRTALAALALVSIFAGTPVLAASSYTNLYNFQPDTSNPLGPLVEDSAAISMVSLPARAPKTAPITVSLSSCPLPPKKAAVGP